MNVTAIVVAAGEGRRMGGEVGKTFLPLAGRAMLLRTLDKFYDSEMINNVVVVVAERDLAFCDSLLRADRRLGSRPWVLQSGGFTRQESVRKGLLKLQSDCDIVVIHDAARPLVSAALITRVIEQTLAKEAIIVGLPVTDTIKVVSEDRRILSTPARDPLWEIQTPQAFIRPLIVEAHETALRDSFSGNDDAVLVERLGKTVYVIEGERTNVKITVPEDVLLAEKLLN
jgi:2-C-methyl-D-erythritol 4-phosphate cytidylyltransferase